MNLNQLNDFIDGLPCREGNRLCCGLRGGNDRDLHHDRSVRGGGHRAIGQIMAR
jgi:hypothetical protein